MTPRLFEMRSVRLLGGSAALTAVTLFGGCTNDPERTSSGEERPSSSVDTSSKVPSGDDGGIEDAIGAVEDLTRFECTKERGVWSASGVLVNSTEDDQQYFLEVTVHHKTKGTVFGDKSETVTVPAGEEKKVRLREVYSGKEDKVDCTPRVVRGS